MKKSAKLWIVIALCLCLISGIGVSAIQTSGGTVTMTEVKWYTTYGYEIDGYLLVPDTATVENPAPGIVCCHGLLNNKEMQDLNYVELSRRGYVVLAIDMLSHGDSAIVSDGSLKNASVYEGALFLNNLDIVDKDRIGITGHSAGGANSNLACAMDNENEERIIAAALINSTDPTYFDGDGNFANVYGSRDVGVIAGQYDEFGFVTKYDDGTQRPTREYIDSNEAQSFLYFGNYEAGLEARSPYTYYEENVDGENCFRVIYNPSLIHPWSHFSKRSTENTIEFFDKAFGAPNAIPASNQVWQWKVFFNVVGLIGFVMFVINCAVAMVDTKFFGSLKAAETVQPVKAANKKAVLCFWASLFLAVIFGAATYLPILVKAQSFPGGPSLFGQKAVFGVSMWALACGGFAIISMIVSRAVLGKDNFNAEAVGLKISAGNAAKTILLAITVAASAYALVFINDYLFHADFRFWVLAVKAFEPRILKISLAFMVILCGYYVTNSIAINCFNYNEVGGKLNLTILTVANALPAVIVVLFQYVYFRIHGIVHYAANSNGPMHLYIVWIFPLVAILPISAVISRKIYVKTKNPYLPGIINAIIVALISCANTVSYL